MQQITILTWAWETRLHRSQGVAATRVSGTRRRILCQCRSTLIIGDLKPWGPRSYILYIFYDCIGSIIHKIEFKKNIYLYMILKAKHLTMISQKRDGYTETETLQLLHSPETSRFGHQMFGGSSRPYGYQVSLRKYSSILIINSWLFLKYKLTSNCTRAMQQIHQFSGGSAAGGGEVSSSVSRNEQQQWQMNHHQAQMFATAAASSGFPSAQFRPQNWMQKNGIHHPLIRPS